MKSLDINKKILDKWLIIPIILLILNFIYRLINQSKMIWTFPVAYANDISSYMAQLFFLIKCGFHKSCPYWYNGFVTFKSTAPGWFFFTLPIYWLTNNIQLSAYISMILIFIAIFIAIYFLGKLHKFSRLKRIAFFCLMFGNAIAVGNFIRLGRFHELFGWLNFIIIAFLTLWYKDNRFDKKVYFIIIPLVLAILSHQYIAILSFIVILSLFIIKRRLKDRIKIVLISFISLVLTSFWWLPFLLSLGETNAQNQLFSKVLFLFSGQWFWQNISTIIVPLGFCIIFYFYWVSKGKSKRELLFYTPILVLAILLLSRIIYFIPILKHVYPDSLNHMFIFFSIFMFLKLDIKVIPKILIKLIPLFLVLIVLISISFNIFYTPFFIDHTDLEKDTFFILNKVDGRFLILKSTSYTSRNSAYYSYAPIYLNLTTAGGFYPHSTSVEYLRKLGDIDDLLENKQCDKLIKNFNYLNTTNIITYNQYCSYLAECGLKEISRKNNVCLFTKSL